MCKHAVACNELSVFFWVVTKGSTTGRVQLGVSFSHVAEAKASIILATSTMIDQIDQYRQYPKPEVLFLDKADNSPARPSTRLHCISCMTCRSDVASTVQLSTARLKFWMPNFDMLGASLRHILICAQWPSADPPTADSHCC